MSSVNARASSGGEEKASGMRSKTLEESGYLGEDKRRRAILVAYLIATLDLTFLFMLLGVMPVSMGCPASQHVGPSMLGGVVFQQSQRAFLAGEERVFLPSRQAGAVVRVCPGTGSWFISCTAVAPRALPWPDGAE